MKEHPIVFPLFGHDDLAHAIHQQCQFDWGTINLHQFPDEEIVIQIDVELNKRTVYFVVNLVNPNSKIIPLLFAAETARSLGAAKIILVAPYLPYMRQDKVFEPGQGVTSAYFATLISTYFDGLITIDPHLHRWKSLDTIYNIETKVLHATDEIANWIHHRIPNPILIGPDSESAQWVEKIAQKASAPFLILEKQRNNDFDVEITLPGIDQYRDKTPVLIDDIVSTGMTLVETLKQLHLLHMPPSVCICVHAVFAGDAYKNLLACGNTELISCNTIPHVSNRIDISNNIINFLS